ncbi:MAG: GAF domain-containing protein [Chloroflexi bacterium]|nr:GAF domain-containing protein [Chloroflexota bacterium]
MRKLNLHPDIRSIHMYPISWESQILGFIVLGSPLALPPSEGEMATMELLAERAAAALDSARLFEEINSNLQRLASLRSIDQAITSSMDIHFTLGILLDQAVSQLKVHAADILLLDQGATSFRYGVGRGFNTTVPPNAMVGIANSFAGRAVLERRTLHVSDLAKESSEFQRPSQFLKEGFVSLFCTPLIAKGQVKGVLEVLHHIPLKPTADWLAFLETLAGQAAIAIDNAELFTNLQRSNADLSLAYDATIQGWSDALDLRDKETEGHTQRVTEMTLKLAAMMGIGEKEMVHLRRGALLHDIGKMGIPDSILLKPGPLTDEEWVIMRKHPVFAHDLISPIVYLRPALDIPFCHHEKWDGTGYPRGLQGELIPLAARIFAVVDVWDALTSDRPYRNAWSKEKTLAHIQEQKDSHFDPKVVDAFMKLISSGDSF